METLGDLNLYYQVEVDQGETCDLKDSATDVKSTGKLDSPVQVQE